MARLKDRYHEFKIACQILKTTPAEKAREWEVSSTAVMYAATGANRSPRLRKLIDQTIEEAQKAVPFSYPSNGQGNGQKAKTENQQIETV